jgi:hypothetical protein
MAALTMVAWLATPMLESGPPNKCTNQYMNFIITADELLLNSAKPHALLRHAKTQLHLQALASVLGVSFGAHVNTTLTLNIPLAPPPTRLRVLV